ISGLAIGPGTSHRRFAQPSRHIEGTHEKRSAKPASQFRSRIPGPASLDQIDSFNSLAARKATFLLALILIASPVAGLRPMRAARLRTDRIPSAGMRTLSPFLRCRPIWL